jgi:hypothetical protein
MPRPAFERADIFRQYGAQYRARHKLPLKQLRVMRAIEVCRTAVLGGHVEKCDQCDHIRIAYNSCRNRHCPKCQNRERAKWLADRKAELLPVEYFHVVFTVPEEIARIAFYNPEVVYGILFRTAAETLLTIARDPQHLGAEIGFFAVLHTWGTKLTASPACTLRRSRRRIIAGPRTLDRMPPRLLPAGESPVAPVPAALSGCAGRCVLSKQAAFPWRD